MGCPRNRIQCLRHPDRSTLFHLAMRLRTSPSPPPPPTPNPPVFEMTLGDNPVIRQCFTQTHLPPNIIHARNRNSQRILTESATWLMRSHSFKPMIWQYSSVVFQILTCAVYAAKTATWFQDSLQWRNNERDGISIHRRIDCLPKRLFWCRSMKTSKLRVTDLCEGNSPVTGEFPAQRASDAENVPIWWRHHVATSVAAELLGDTRPRRTMAILSFNPTGNWGALNASVIR